jgi:hypothetical protein
MSACLDRSSSCGVNRHVRRTGTWAGTVPVDKESGFRETNELSLPAAFEMAAPARSMKKTTLLAPPNPA